MKTSIKHNFRLSTTWLAKVALSLMFMGFAAANLSFAEEKRDTKNANDEKTTKIVKNQLESVSARNKTLERELNQNRAKLAEALAKNSDLENRIRRLNNQLAEAESKVAENAFNGLWAFRIDAEKIVDYRGNSEPVDYVLDYYIWMQSNEGKLVGRLFGVRAISGRDIYRSNFYGDGEIAGTVRGSTVRATLKYQGEGLGLEAAIRMEEHGEQYLGTLEVGKPHFNSFNIVGKFQGRKLQESDLHYLGR